MTSKKQTAEIVLWMNGKDASTFPSFWQVIPCMDVQSLVLPLARAEGKEEGKQEAAIKILELFNEITYPTGKGLRIVPVSKFILLVNARFLKEKEETK